jgi:succinate dehydrogenase/fumarate reductase flavoprotein subunit
MCGGYVSATEAAGALSQMEALPPVGLEEVSLEKDRIFKPMKTTGGIDYRKFELAIRQVMTYYMGYVRNEKGMAIALERLHLIEGYLDRLQASDFHELMRVNEAVHLLKMCQLSTKATMERKESRRSIYRRSDYPDLHEAYARVLAIWQEDGQPQLSWL